MAHSINTIRGSRAVSGSIDTVKPGGGIGDDGRLALHTLVPNPDEPVNEDPTAFTALDRTHSNLSNLLVGLRQANDATFFTLEETIRAMTRAVDGRIQINGLPSRIPNPDSSKEMTKIEQVEHVFGMMNDELLYQRRLVEHHRTLTEQMMRLL